MKRYLPIAAVLLFSLLGGVAYAAGSVSLASQNSVSLAGGASVASGSTVGSINGFSTHPPASDPGLATYYAELLAIGASWQRTDLPWDSVQATSSASFVWGPWDTRVNEAIADGISTVFIIDQTPTWAAYFNCASGAGTCAPENAATLATYCTAAATHFNGRVTNWEIWNEQNANGNWGPAATSSDYVVDLNACNAAIKAVEPTANIITGGLSSGGAITFNQSVTDYIADGAQFDMLGLHPYTYQGFPNDGGALGWATRVDSVRAQLNAAGMSSKQIAITEYGAPTCGPASTYSTFEQQALMAQQVVATSSSAYMNLWNHIFWYTLVDTNSNDPSTIQNCFGAYYTNGTPKQVFWPIKNS